MAIQRSDGSASPRRQQEGRSRSGSPSPYRRREGSPAPPLQDTSQSTQQTEPCFVRHEVGTGPNYIKGAVLRMSKPLPKVARTAGRSEFFAELANLCGLEVQRLLRYTLLGYANPVTEELERKAEADVQGGLCNILEYLAKYVESAVGAVLDAARKAPRYEAEEVPEPVFAGVETSVLTEQLDRSIEHNQRLSKELQERDGKLAKATKMISRMRRCYLADLENHRIRFRSTLMMHLPSLPGKALEEIMDHFTIVRLFEPENFVDDDTADIIRTQANTLMADFSTEREALQQRITGLKDTLESKRLLIEALQAKVRHLQEGLKRMASQGDNEAHTILERAPATDEKHHHHHHHPPPSPPPDEMARTQSIKDRGELARAMQEVEDLNRREGTLLVQVNSCQDLLRMQQELITSLFGTSQHSMLKPVLTDIPDRLAEMQELLLHKPRPPEEDAEQAALKKVEAASNEASILRKERDMLKAQVTEKAEKMVDLEERLAEMDDAPGELGFGHTPSLRNHRVSATSETSSDEGHGGGGHEKRGTASRKERLASLVAGQQQAAAALAAAAENAQAAQQLLEAAAAGPHVSLYHPHPHHPHHQRLSREQTQTLLQEGVLKELAVQTEATWLGPAPDPKGKNPKVGHAYVQAGEAPDGRRMGPHDVDAVFALQTPSSGPRRASGETSPSMFSSSWQSSIGLPSYEPLAELSISEEQEMSPLSETKSPKPKAKHGHQTGRARASAPPTSLAAETIEELAQAGATGQPADARLPQPTPHGRRLRTPRNGSKDNKDGSRPGSRSLKTSPSPEELQALPKFGKEPKEKLHVKADRLTPPLPSPSPEPEPTPTQQEKSGSVKSVSTWRQGWHADISTKLELTKDFESKLAKERAQLYRAWPRVASADPPRQRGDRSPRSKSKAMADEDLDELGRDVLRERNDALRSIDKARFLAYGWQGNKRGTAEDGRIEDFLKSKELLEHYKSLGGISKRILSWREDVAKLQEELKRALFDKDKLEAELNQAREHSIQKGCNAAMLSETQAACIAQCQDLLQKKGLNILIPKALLEATSDDMVVAGLIRDQIAASRPDEKASEEEVQQQLQLWSDRLRPQLLAEAKCAKVEQEAAAIRTAEALGKLRSFEESDHLEEQVEKWDDLKQLAELGALKVASKDKAFLGSTVASSLKKSPSKKGKELPSNRELSEAWKKSIRGVLQRLEVVRRATEKKNTKTAESKRAAEAHRAFDRLVRQPTRKALELPKIFEDSSPLKGAMAVVSTAVDLYERLDCMLAAPEEKAVASPKGEEPPFASIPRLIELQPPAESRRTSAQRALHNGMRRTSTILWWKRLGRMRKARQSVVSEVEGDSWMAELMSEGYASETPEPNLRIPRPGSSPLATQPEDIEEESPAAGGESEEAEGGNVSSTPRKGTLPSVAGKDEPVQAGSLRGFIKVKAADGSLLSLPPTTAEGQFEEEDAEGPSRFVASLLEWSGVPLERFQDSAWPWDPSQPEDKAAGAPFAQSPVNGGSRPSHTWARNSLSPGSSPRKTPSVASPRRSPDPRQRMSEDLPQRTPLAESIASAICQPGVATPLGVTTPSASLGPLDEHLEERRNSRGTAVRSSVGGTSSQGRRGSFSSSTPGAGEQRRSLEEQVRFELKLDTPRKADGVKDAVLTRVGAVGGRHSLLAGIAPLPIAEKPTCEEKAVQVCVIGSSSVIESSGETSADRPSGVRSRRNSLTPNGSRRSSRRPSLASSGIGSLPGSGVEQELPETSPASSCFNTGALHLASSDAIEVPGSSRTSIAVPGGGADAGEEVLSPTGSSAKDKSPLARGWHVARRSVMRSTKAAIRLRPQKAAAAPSGPRSAEVETQTLRTDVAEVEVQTEHWNRNVKVVGCQTDRPAVERLEETRRVAWIRARKGMGSFKRSATLDQGHDVFAEAFQQLDKEGELRTYNGVDSELADFGRLAEVVDCAQQSDLKLDEVLEGVVGWLKLNLLQREHSVLYNLPWEISAPEHFLDLPKARRERIVQDFELFLDDVLCRPHPFRHVVRRGHRQRYRGSLPGRRHRSASPEGRNAEDEGDDAGGGDGALSSRLATKEGGVMSYEVPLLVTPGDFDHRILGTQLLHHLGGLHRGRAEVAPLDFAASLHKPSQNVYLEGQMPFLSPDRPDADAAARERTPLKHLIGFNVPLAALLQSPEKDPYCLATAAEHHIEMPEGLQVASPSSPASPTSPSRVGQLRSPGAPTSPKAAVSPQVLSLDMVKALGDGSSKVPRGPTPLGGGGPLSPSARVAGPDSPNSIMLKGSGRDGGAQGARRILHEDDVAKGPTKEEVLGQVGAILSQACSRTMRFGLQRLQQAAASLPPPQQAPPAPRGPAGTKLLKKTKRQVMPVTVGEFFEKSQKALLELETSEAASQPFSAVQRPVHPMLYAWQQHHQQKSSAQGEGKDEPASYVGCVAWHYNASGAPAAAPQQGKGARELGGGERSGASLSPEPKPAEPAPPLPVRPTQPTSGEQPAGRGLPSLTAWRKMGTEELKAKGSSAAAQPPPAAQEERPGTRASSQTRPSQWVPLTARPASTGSDDVTMPKLPSHGSGALTARGAAPGDTPIRPASLQSGRAAARRHAAGGKFAASMAAQGHGGL